jgi:phosphate transport system permease protein
MLLVPLVREGFGRGSGFCILSATLVLSVLILPTIVLLVHAQMRSVRAQTRPTCAALGLAARQEVLLVTLPLTVRGIVTAGILGFGRAIGDTMIALMVAGNAPQTPTSMFDSIRTLTAHIALVVATDSQSAMYRSIFAAGIILFIITAVVNLSARRLAGIMTERSGHGRGAH